MRVDDLTYGTEIECTVPMSARVARGGYHRGRQVDCLPTGWNGQSDISIYCRGNRLAVEIVSPVMSGESGIGDVADAIDKMDEIGATTNASCGHHVHIALDRYDTVTRQRVLKLVKRYEMSIFALNGETAWDRYTNGFCTPIATMPLDYYYQGLPEGHSCALNFANSATVEFRMFDATFDLVDILTRIMVCLALVAYAHNHPEEVDRMPNTEVDTMDGAHALVSILSDNECRLCPDWEWDDIRANILSRCRTADRLAPRHTPTPTLVNGTWVIA